MDWTSIYVEDGSEDLIIPQLMEKKPTTSRLTRLASRVFHQYEETSGDGDEAEAELSGGHRLMELVDSNRHVAHRYSLREVYFLSINYILGRYEDTHCIFFNGLIGSHTLHIITF
jgi:hypothetical protein